MEYYDKELWLNHHGSLSVYHHTPHDPDMSQWTPKYTVDGFFHGLMGKGETYEDSVANLFNYAKESLWGFINDQ